MYHIYYIKIPLNIILDTICLKFRCLWYVYCFIIYHNFEKKIEVFVGFGGEIYTSIVQCYAPLVEINDVSFQIIILWKQQLLCDGLIWMESKPYCEKILNHIQQVIRISCIWQLQFVLYGYVAMKTESNATYKCQSWD